jgi:hypothetical protein
MARSRHDVLRSRTTSVLARILALLGIEPGRWAIRHAYAQVPTRRLAVPRARGATSCCVGTTGRRPGIYTAGAGEPPTSCMKGNRSDA